MSFAKIGTYDYKSLLADAHCAAEKAAINVMPGQGLLTIGTVLYRGENGMYSAAAEADCVSTKNLCVLNEEIDTTTSEEALVAAAYRNGRLLAEAVHLKNGAALTATNKLALRQQGILLKAGTGAAEFNNEI